MPNMTFDVEPEQFVDLKLSAVRHKISMSKIVNQLIKNFIEEERAVLAKKEKENVPVAPDVINTDITLPTE